MKLKETVIEWGWTLVLVLAIAVFSTLVWVSDLWAKIRGTYHD
jgi:hypothetical protein